MTKGTVLLELDFYLLIVFSLVAPIAIYAFLYRRRAISRNTVLVYGLVLIVLAGVDLVLLHRVSEFAARNPALDENWLFASEISTALYLLPALFAGVGVNLVSHVLISHISEAEKLFDREHER